MRILLPLIHLLLELLRLFLIREAQAKHTFLALEAVEECAVLVVGECIIYLLIPDDAAVGRRNVDEFQPERVAYQIVGQDYRALEPGEGPSLAARKRDVEFRYSDCVDLVGLFGYAALDCLFVVVGEDRRHARAGLSLQASEVDVCCARVTVGCTSDARG